MIMQICALAGNIPSGNMIKEKLTEATLLDAVPGYGKST